MALTWLGNRVKDLVARSAIAAIDDTMEAAAARAAADTPVGETGLASSSITVLEKAHRDGRRVVGRWGGPPLPPSDDYTSSSRVRVFFLEVGFRGKPGRHMLRRAADREYPQLSRRIRRVFELRGSRSV